jgi:hypothetical protein
MVNQSLKILTSVERFQELMRGLNIPQRLSLPILEAALDCHERTAQRDVLLHQVRDFFATRATRVPKGLDRLPAVWLTQIPGVLWATRKPHWESLPYFIGAFGVEQGILRVAYLQEQPSNLRRINMWDQLRVTLNISLKPNLWTPLTNHEERAVWEARPDLHAELFRVR